MSSRSTAEGQPTSAVPAKVLLLTEGSYPFFFGGVSTWCHSLIRGLSDVRFSLMSIIDDPARPLRFDVPDNVERFEVVPLWGVRSASEHRIAATAPFRRAKRKATTDSVLERDLAPRLRSFIDLLLTPTCRPMALAGVIHTLYRFFVEHDFDRSMSSRQAWQAVDDAIAARYADLTAAVGCGEVTPVALSDVTQALLLVRAWLTPLAAPLPDVDVVHASTAGICSLVAVAAKVDQGAGYLLTEHGIYLREQYLASASANGSLFIKLLQLRFARRTTELSYALADQVSPCCDDHQRWELQVGAPPERLSTIYYGVDTTVFSPAAKPRGAPPTVAWVGRIDPLKDLETLLRAAAAVHAKRPDIQFRLHGAALPGGDAYAQQCLILRRELGLESVVAMPGYTASPQAAFNESDLVVLSSISEGFPYSTLEAMLCGKAIVATAVGGLAEQIGGCGVVVEPRNHEQLADAIVELMADPEELARMGMAARQRAERLFNSENERRYHLAAYARVRVMTATSRLRAVDLAPVEGRPHTSTTLVALWRSARLSQRLRQGAREAGHLLGSQLEGVVQVARALEASFRPARLVAVEGVDSTVVTTVDRAAGAPVAEGAVIAARDSVARVDGARVDDSVAPRQLTRPSDRIWQRVVRRALSRASETAVNTEWSVGIESREMLLAAPVDLALLESLTEDLHRYIPLPVDALEISAVLESWGTSSVAIERCGATDVFELGEILFERLQPRRQAVKPAPYTPPVPDLPRYAHARAAARFALQMVPTLAALALVARLSVVGFIGTGESWALFAGIVAGSLLSLGLLHGLTPRASLYVGCGNWAFARRLVSRFTMTVALPVVAGLGALGLVAAAVDRGPPDERIFVVGVAASTGLWLSSAGLVVVQRFHHVGVAVGLGAVVAVAVDAAAVGYWPHHVVIGVLSGYGVALVAVIVDVRRGLFRHGPPSTSPLTLPPGRELLTEALPYAIQSALVILLLALPHVFGWMMLRSTGEQRGVAFTAIEICLNAPLLALLTMSILLERSARLFWLVARDGQMTTMLNERARFGSLMSSFRARRRRAQVACQLLVGVLVIGVVEIAAGPGGYGEWLRALPSGTFHVTLVLASLSYLLLGCALLDGVLALNLRLPWLTVKALAPGLAIGLLAGMIALNWLPPFYAPLPLLAGSATSMTLYSLQLRPRLRRADHTYLGAL